MTEETNDTPLGSKELTVANEFLHPLVPYGPVKAMREMTRRIMLFDNGKVKMTPTEASHFAQLCLSAQLNPFDGEIWGWVDARGDERKLTIMPGRRGLLRHAHEQAAARGTHFWPRYEQLTDPERRANLRIPDGALAFECKLYDHQAVTTWTAAISAVTDAAKAGVSVDASDLGSTPVVWGLGILTSQEMAGLDRNSQNRMTHVERCQKRAYMMALKQMFDLPLAGYVGTQGETVDDFVLDAEWREVPTEDPEPRPTPSPEKVKAGTEALYGKDETPKPTAGVTPRSWPDEFVEHAMGVLINAGALGSDTHVKHVIMLLNLSPFGPDVKDDELAEWASVYRALRESGMTTKEAAAEATVKAMGNVPF